jgi:hypothetical protein
VKTGASGIEGSMARALASCCGVNLAGGRFSGAFGFGGHAGYSVRRSAFSVRRSAFSVQRSAYGVQRSAFSVQRSAFSVQRIGRGGGVCGSWRKESRIASGWVRQVDLWSRWLQFRVFGCAEQGCYSRMLFPMSGALRVVNDVMGMVDVHESPVSEAA